MALTHFSQLTPSLLATISRSTLPPHALQQTSNHNQQKTLYPTNTTSLTTFSPSVSTPPSNNSWYLVSRSTSLRAALLCAEVSRSSGDGENGTSKILFTPSPNSIEIQNPKGKKGTRNVSAKKGSRAATDDLCYAVRSVEEANTPDRYLKVAPFQEKRGASFLRLTTLPHANVRTRTAAEHSIFRRCAHSLLSRQQSKLFRPIEALRE
jgi:hypothetical protein